MRRNILGLILALGLAGPALGQTSWPLIAPTPPTSDSSDRIATTQWVNNFFATGIPLASGKIFIGSAGGVATAQTLSGDCTLVASGVIICSQAAGNFNVIGNLTVGGSIIDGNGLLMTNIAAPATPSAGATRVYVDSTTKTLSAKNDAGTVSNTVVASTAVANQFMTGISATGTVTRAQPAVSDLSGLPVTIAQGGTNCVAASGTCLDNITGFASTGYANRTGAGAYSFNAAATNANFQAGTANKVVESGVIYQAEVAVTFNATSVFDFSTFSNASETLTGNVTTQTLNNVTAGKAGTIRFIQDGTGSRTTVWNSIFKWAAGGAPTLSTTAAAIDVLSYTCVSSTLCYVSLTKDMR